MAFLKSFKLSPSSQGDFSCARVAALSSCPLYAVHIHSLNCVFKKEGQIDNLSFCQFLMIRRWFWAAIRVFFFHCAQRIGAWVIENSFPCQTIHFLKSKIPEPFLV